MGSECIGRYIYNWRFTSSHRRNLGEGWSLSRRLSPPARASLPEGTCPLSLIRGNRDGYCLLDAGSTTLYIVVESYSLIRLGGEASQPSTWGCKSSWHVSLPHHPLPYAPRSSEGDTREWVPLCTRATNGSEESEQLTAVAVSPRMWPPLRTQNILIVGRP